MLLFIATQLALVPVLGLILIGLINERQRNERVYKAFIKQLIKKRGVSR